METQPRFTSSQIAAAKETAELHGIRDMQSVTDSQAIEWLEWYFLHDTEYTSVEEARRAGLYGLVTNGIDQQVEAWNSIFAR